MNDMLEKLNAFLESDEGKKAAEEFFNKKENEDLIKESQLERFHIKYNDSMKFSSIVETIIKKYESDKYRSFWYNRGIEPPEDLYFFLYDYAEKYGRKATDNEYKEHGNCFTYGLYYIHGYFFNLMHGQGSCILISKE